MPGAGRRRLRPLALLPPLPLLPAVRAQQQEQDASPVHRRTSIVVSLPACLPACVLLASKFWLVGEPFRSIDPTPCNPMHPIITSTIAR